MSGTVFQEIKHSLLNSYQADPRPWFVGFSGGKDSTFVASLIFDTASCRSRLGSMK
jgi:DNA sulfur modification protein DndC